MDVNWSIGWTDLRKFYDHTPRSSSHPIPTTVIVFQAITRLHKASQAFPGRTMALGVMYHMRRPHCSCKSRLPLQPRASQWTSQILCLRLLRCLPCMETSFLSNRHKQLRCPSACNGTAALNPFNPGRRPSFIARTSHRLSHPVSTSRNPQPMYRQMPHFLHMIFYMLL